MRIALLQNSKLLVIGLPLSLILFLFLLTQTASFQTQAGPLSNAITLDLLLTLPILYFLLIRKKEIPKITVASVFVVGMLVASFIIPVENQQLLSQIKLIAIPLVELTVISYILYNTYHTVRQFKKEEKQNVDFFTALKKACSESFPDKIGHLLATEIAVIYYAFFAWKKKRPASHTYTYHLKSGIITVVYALFFIIAIETFVAHFLLHKWNPVVAWVLTGLSVYTCVQIFALTRSMKFRPFELDYEKGILHLRYGFFNEVSIPFEEIAKIELSRKTLPDDKSITQFSALGMLDTHNTIIHLKSEHEMSRMYGLRKKVQALALYLDKKEEFAKAIKQAMNKDAV